MKTYVMIHTGSTRLRVIAIFFALLSSIRGYTQEAVSVGADGGRMSMTEHPAGWEIGSYQLRPQPEAGSKILEINVFPNPVESLLSVSLPTVPVAAKGSFEIYDVTGRRLRAGTFSSPRFSLDCSGLASQMYILRASCNGMSGSKLIEKK